MNGAESLKHTRWECKYYVVFIPKYRKKSIYGWLRKELGPIIRELARQKETFVEEGHLMSDHVHVLLSVPPKYSVVQVVGFIKGKSAIAIARNFMGRTRNFTDQHFGLGGIMFRRLVETRDRFGSTSGSRRERAEGSIS